MLGRKLSLWIGTILLIATVGWNRLGITPEPNHVVLPRELKTRSPQMKNREERKPTTVRVPETDLLITHASSRLVERSDDGETQSASAPTQEQVQQVLQMIEDNGRAITPDQNWMREFPDEDGSYQATYTGLDGTQIRQWYQPGDELTIQETTFADQSKFTTWFSHETEDGPQKLIEYHSGTQGWQVSLVNGYPKRVRFWNGDAPEFIHDF